MLKPLASKLKSSKKLYPRLEDSINFRFMKKENNQTKINLNFGFLLDDFFFF